MSGNIIIYLHIAMIFAQHNDYLRNICCTIFGMCCFLLLDNLIFNSIWIAHVHLLRRDVHGERLCLSKPTHEPLWQI